jgi:hypothetical protein
MKWAQVVALAALCSGFFLLALTFAPYQPEISPDSFLFLGFEPDKTAGYPMFLALVGWFDGQLSILSVIQLLILCSSTLFFSVAVYRMTGYFLCAIAVVALMLGNYEVVKYSFRVLSEALFISLLALLLASVAFWFATRRLRWMVAASTFLGAAVTVRPAGYALFVMLPILYAWAWRLHDRRMLAMGAMVAPAAIVLLLSLAAYHHRHGTWHSSSVLGYNLLGKVSVFADGTERSSRPDLIDAVKNIAARYRARLAMGETWSDRILLANPYDSIRKDILSADNAGLGLGKSAAADRAMTWLALDIIAAHKAAYIWNVAENYAALWYVPELMTQQDVTRIQQQIAKSSTPTMSIGFPLVARPWLLVKSLRLFQLGVLTMSLAFLIALPLQLIMYRQADPILWFGFTATSALHACVILVAAINESKPRLMLDSWPILVSLVILGLAWSAASCWPGLRARIAKRAAVRWTVRRYEKFVRVFKSAAP